MHLGDILVALQLPPIHIGAVSEKKEFDNIWIGAWMVLLS